MKYIEEIEEAYLQNPIDYSNFDEEEFDDVLKCEFCNSKFNHYYNDRCIIFSEIVDKEKLQYISDNNDFDEEVWDKFNIDCSKFITGCSLSLDLMLKYTGVKIQLFKDITMFDFTDSSIMGGLCIASENIADNDDGKSNISSCDVSSLYPYIMSQKLPVSNYKFVSNFDKNKYGQDKNCSCLLNIEIYTTKKVLNNKTLSQFPALISKSIMIYDQLSQYQRKNLKENFKSSEKLITHLGYDRNSYISFEMYEMMKSLGYKINIKKILEYKHSNFMKPYINFLFEKKSYYKSIGDKGISLTFKTLMNALFGVMMTQIQIF